MAEIESHMTPEQLENNYEYKVVKRALMKEFPWIKDVTFTPNELDQYNTIFLNLIVDPMQMKDTYGYEFNSWVSSRIERGENYRGNYPSLLFDVSYEQGKEDIMDPLNKMIQQIRNSPALPQDMRLPKGRSFQATTFVINPDGPEW